MQYAALFKAPEIAKADEVMRFMAIAAAAFCEPFKVSARLNNCYKTVITIHYFQANDYTTGLIDESIRQAHTLSQLLIPCKIYWR